jgi:hypothetical protein
MKEADELERQAAELAQTQAAEFGHATSLRPAREGALFMEQTYYAWDLEATRSQPLSLGVMNFFARWSYAPLFRMWWPIMRSTRPPQRHGREVPARQRADPLQEARPSYSTFR